MASYPSAKVHRHSRRKLGRGQYVQPPAVTATPVASTVTLTTTFSVPVVVNGVMDFNLGGGSPPTVLTQTVVSPTEIRQIYSATVVGHTWDIGPTDPSIRSFQGGALAPASGTF